MNLNKTKNVHLGSTLDSFLDELKQNNMELTLNKITNIISGANSDYSLVEYKNLLDLRWGGNGLFIKILDKKTDMPFYCIIEFSEDDVKLNEKDTIEIASGKDFQLNIRIVLEIIRDYFNCQKISELTFYQYKNNKIVQIEDMAGEADTVYMDLNDPIKFIFDHFDSNSLNEAIVPRMRIVEVSPEELYQLESE